MDDKIHIVLLIIIYVIALIIAICYFVSKKTEKNKTYPPEKTSQKSSSLYVRKRLRTPCEE